MNESPLNEDELRRLELAAKQADLTNKKWELFFKWIGLATVLFGIAWPIFQYTRTLRQNEVDRQARAAQEITQRDKELATARREAQRPFLELQLKLYTEAVAVAGKLNTLAPGPDRDRARRRFEELYWSELSVVEDKQVEVAMMEFKCALERYEQATAAQRAEAAGRLKCRSLKLAHGVRDSLARGWQYERGSATDKPEATPEFQCLPCDEPFAN